MTKGEMFMKPGKGRRAVLQSRATVFARLSGNCTCYKCIGINDPTMIGRIMVVCPTCGNKRCPNASDHELACTGSNEPGQAGSLYY